MGINILKETNTEIVVEGKFDDRKRVTEPIWMGIRKRLPKKAVVMWPTYDENSNTTTFNFGVSTALFDEDVLEHHCSKIKKRLRAGKPINTRVYQSMVGKRISGYMTLHIVEILPETIEDDGESHEVPLADKKWRVEIIADSQRFCNDMLNKATIEFASALIAHFDGSTPEEMARDFVTEPLVG